MLIRYARMSGGRIQPAAQRGVVLLIALIMLVAMTLGGIALVRSVNTTTIIAGNLAFQQGATHSADTGIEAAVTWLQTNNGPTLYSPVAAQGYAAIRGDPGVGQSWDAFWRAVLTAQSVALPVNASGYTVSYAIQRLCAQALPPSSAGAGCSQPPATAAPDTSSKGAGVVALQYSNQVYYRITSRVAGPRNTVSYVQAIVAL